MICSVYQLTKEIFAREFPSLPSFRFSQIENRRSAGLLTFAEYGNLGAETVKLLDASFSCFSSKVKQRFDGSESGKILVELYDGEKTEAVCIKSAEGRTVCLSSQVGCALGCKFCATGTLGFKRNLKDYEIVEQFYHLKRLFGKIDNIVFMGMGEPMYNLDAVCGAIRYFRDCEKISVRRITVSTSGVADMMKVFADRGLGVKLTLSLVTANEGLRCKLMPIARKWNLQALKDSLLYFQRKDKRRITLACCMLKNTNMSAADAMNIKNFSRGLICHVNLIPWNKTEKLPFDTPDANSVREFEGRLTKLGLVCTIRNSKGDDINSACGELALKDAEE